MSFIRGLSRWLLTLAIGVSLAVWIAAATAHTIVLNEQTVKGWFAASGVYQHALQDTVKISTSQGAASKEDLQKALTATFPPSYIQQQSEVVIHATYDWLAGKTPDINFSIPLKEKRPEYSANLQKELEVTFGSLPQCQTRLSPATDKPTCLPQGATAKNVAALSSQIPETSDFLNKPITSQSLVSNAQIPDFSALPGAVRLIEIAFFTLPFAVAVFAAVYVGISEDRLRALGAIGLHMSFQGLLIAIGGAGMWYFGTNVSAQGLDQQQILVANPLFQQIVPNLGSALALFAGIVTAIGGIVWLTSFMLRRRSKAKAMVNSPRQL